MRKLMALYPNYAANTSPQACGLTTGQSQP
jgi:hypothetical protein